MTAPTPKHLEEHTELTKLLGKLVKASSNVSVFVLVTIGNDGMPCVGGNLAEPSDLHEVMRQLSNPESVAKAQRHVIPRDN